MPRLVKPATTSSFNIGYACLTLDELFEVLAREERPDIRVSVLEGGTRYTGTYFPDMVNAVVANGEIRIYLFELDKEGIDEPETTIVLHKPLDSPEEFSDQINNVEFAEGIVSISLRMTQYEKYFVNEKRGPAGIPGQMYWDNSLSKIRYWDGVRWRVS